MKPKIDDCKFGWITVAGKKYRYDVVIGLGGEVRKRKKKLSKALYGTSHILSLEEAKDIYQRDAKRLIIGSGQQGLVQLSDEAAQYLHDHGCQVYLLPTREAMQAWNEAEGATLGLFHVTC